MEKVAPSTICYAAIQVRLTGTLQQYHLKLLDLQTYVALCCSKEWKEEWKGIKFARLYILLREQFAYPEDPWYANTLQWWNEQVFGASPETDEGVPEAAQDMQGPSTCERGDNERQQRIQAAVAAGN